MDTRRRHRWTDDEAERGFSPLDRALSRLHASVFKRHPLASLLASIGLYAAVVLAFGPRLAVSNNYFVGIPVIVAAVSYGLAGGAIAGALGLPANLLLFAVLGRPDFSPASKPIAEAFGIVLGTALGYLSDYFRKLEAEIARRVRVEEQLREALGEKQLLLEELHHRVKNNLNVIKSLVQLQRDRARDPEFIAAAEDLMSRILAMATVHESLYAKTFSGAIEPEPYFASLLASLAQARGGGVELSSSVDAGGLLLPVDAAVPLALVVNEAVTNAFKHAFEGLEDRRIRLTLGHADGACVLVIEDNGRGGASKGPAGLGTRIVRALAVQLGGTYSYGPARELASGDPGRPGTRIELRFPCLGKRLDPDALDEETPCGKV